jgi:ferredoxin-NADP reductase
VTGLRDETPDARTVSVAVPRWPGHDAGQHVDVRLTAPDGYTATRSYSIASAVDGEHLELTVERLPDGEVSPYLAGELAVGDVVEVRGPIGGWFVWRPEQAEPVQLIAGGSGIVPLMAMVRTHAARGSTSPMRLLYSVRAPDAMFYREELERRAETERALDVAYAYTRTAPTGWPAAPQRIDAGLIADRVLAADTAPTTYVCGPTGFVEAVSGLLIDAGHDASRIRTERFGPTGGRP